MLALGQAIVAFGMEVEAFRAEFYRSSGLGAKSALGIEFGYRMHDIFRAFCVDGLDGTRLASMEHAARRVLQIQRATKEGAGKAPALGGMRRVRLAMLMSRCSMPGPRTS